MNWGEGPALGREKDDCLAGGVAVGFGRQGEGLEAVKDRLGLEDHAFAAAKWAVVHGAVAVVGKSAEVVGVEVDEPCADGSSDDAVIERAGEERREDGDEVEAHEDGWVIDWERDG